MMATKTVRNIALSSAASAAAFLMAALPAYAYGGYSQYQQNYQYSAPRYSYQMPSQQYGYRNSYTPQASAYNVYDPAPYYSAPYSYGYSNNSPYYDYGYSPFTFESGYYGSCNGQPCGGAFMPNSPYYGGFIIPPGANYYW